MLKFLIIVFLVAYVVYKVGGFFFKAFSVGGGPEGQRPFDDHQRRKPSDGNVYVDSKTKSAEKSQQDFKGGEYVEYEEVD